MNYRDYKAIGLPIGSNVSTEAGAARWCLRNGSSSLA